MSQKWAFSIRCTVIFWESVFSKYNLWLRSFIGQELLLSITLFRWIWFPESMCSFRFQMFRGIRAQSRLWVCILSVSLTLALAAQVGGCRGHCSSTAHCITGPVAPAARLHGLAAWVDGRRVGVGDMHCVSSASCSVTLAALLSHGRPCAVPQVPSSCSHCRPTVYSCHSCNAICDVCSPRDDRTWSKIEIAGEQGDA